MIAPERYRPMSDKSNLTFLSFLPSLSAIRLGRKWLNGGACPELVEVPKGAWPGRHRPALLCGA